VSPTRELAETPAPADTPDTVHYPVKAGGQIVAVAIRENISGFERAHELRTYGASSHRIRETTSNSGLNDMGLRTDRKPWLT
jgi:hypothetical protein